MAQNAKIALSEQELQLLQNTEWILTKRTLIQKVDALLGSAVPSLQALANSHTWLPAEVTAANPKIHRGENYRGLPYVSLDYPAFFSKDGTLSLRNLFWWGHFFSITLHLSGVYKTQFESTLQENLHLLQQTDMVVCTGNTEWEHHFGADNYTPTAQLTVQQLQQIISEKSFVKIAVKCNLALWHDIPGIIVRQTGNLLALIAP